MRLFTIKEVSSRTGLSTQLIRKWEERYGAVTPDRFPNGYRGYTQQDIEALVWLKQKADEGMPIHLAVQADKERRQNLQGWSEDKKADDSSLNGVALYRNRLLEALLHLHGAEATRIVDQLVVMHHLDFVLLEVLQPVLVRIGELWEEGTIFDYQEHFGSHFIRDRILGWKQLYKIAEDSPIVVTACSPDERHELGILMVGHFAMKHRFQIIHLGPSPSEKGIRDCLIKLEPAAIALSTSSVRILEEKQPFYRELDRLIEEKSFQTKIMIGGSVITEDGLMPGTRHVHYVRGDAREAVDKIKQLVSRPLAAQ